MSSKILQTIYSTRNLLMWSKKNMMQHASGIWGRKLLLSYLKDKIKKGDTVIDLGCGTGYPTYYLTKYSGVKGKVFGYDSIKIFIDIASKSYKNHKNLFFHKYDITHKLPHKPNSVDCFTSFMLIQNMRGVEINQLFKEIKRCMKFNGCAVFLTLHPSIYDSEWNLDFIKYNEDSILHWKKTRVNDLLLKGYVKNSGGGEKDVFMYTHSKKQINDLLNKNKLTIVDDIPIHIDQKTATEFFGQKNNRKYPTTPTFWIFSVMKTSKN